jgi:5-methylcytosine-specific restriction endonuclease McrA
LYKLFNITIICKRTNLLDFAQGNKIAKCRIPPLVKNWRRVL